MQNSTWKFLRPEESKSELLALAKEGLTKKELRKKRRDLYVRFGKYIRPMSNGKTNSTYDGEFHKKIKEINPSWLLCQFPKRASTLDPNGTFSSDLRVDSEKGK